MIKLRGMISLLLVIIFLVTSLTGIKLFLSPKEKATTLHIVAGFLMIVLVIVHLVLNYKLLTSELKNLFKRGGKYHV